MTLLTSLHNVRVKEIVALRDKSTRDETGKFLIEGYRELLRAQEAKFPMEQLFFCPDFFLGENEHALINQIKQSGATLFPCSAPVFKKISYRDRPDGLLATAAQKRVTLSEIKVEKNPLYVVVEAIEKPGNLGTILRSADAAGVDALIVCDRCTDIFNPNVVRASVGTLFHIPVIETDSRSCIEWLHKQGIALLAATPHAEKVFTEIDMRGPLAIVLGSEQYGLSEQWMQATDLLTRIPMHGKADSLNVAMAATLLLYEAVRQRACLS